MKLSLNYDDFAMPSTQEQVDALSHILDKLNTNEKWDLAEILFALEKQGYIKGPNYKKLENIFKWQKAKGNI